MLNKLKPFFKGRRKYKTLILGGLPIFCIFLLPVGLIFEIDILSCLLIPGIPVYILAVILLDIMLNVLHIDASIDDKWGAVYNITSIIFLFAPLIVYSGLFLLFLLSCRYYSRKRIKAYKKITKALTVLWIIIGIIFLIGLIR